MANMLARMPLLLSVLLLGAVLPANGDLLNPRAFKSLGVLPPGGSYSINTFGSAPTMRGGVGGGTAVDVTGVYVGDPAVEGGAVAVFTFDAIDVNTIAVSGLQPVALLSKSGFTLSGGSIELSANGPQPGPGALLAGGGFGDAIVNGPNHGVAGGGGGGGFGGGGGSGGASGPPFPDFPVALGGFGGGAYAGLEGMLQGGSSGGAGGGPTFGFPDDGRGGGGGGLEIGALGAVRIGGDGIRADGAGGSSNDGYGGSGGGSGGGIILHGLSVEIASLVSARGGDGGSGGSRGAGVNGGGGGGGGGEVLIVAGQGGFTGLDHIDVSGGAGGRGFNPGNAGDSGQIITEVVPEPTSLILLGIGVLGLLGSSRLTFRGPRPTAAATKSEQEAKAGTVNADTEFEGR